MELELKQPKLNPVTMTVTPIFPPGTGKGMQWLSHKNHIKERKIVEKGKPKTTKISMSR